MGADRGDLSGVIGGAHGRAPCAASSQRYRAPPTRSRETSMTMRDSRYRRGTMEFRSTYSASFECAPAPAKPKRSRTGACVLEAANAASVPPPSALSSISSDLPSSP